jgi:hypothetical protein
MSSLCNCAGGRGFDSFVKYSKCERILFKYYFCTLQLKIIHFRS